MKSLNARFLKVQTSYPLYASLHCFYHAVKGQGFSRKILAYWFNKLVDKSDYLINEKKAILADLEEVTKCRDEGMKSTQTLSQRDDLKESHVQ